jgi:hypothetical protein
MLQRPLAMPRPDDEAPLLILIQARVAGFQGAAIMFAIAAGTPGANFGDGIHASGIGNGNVNDQPIGAFVGTTTGGYWELAPVPLPAGLPLLLSALGVLGWFKRRSISGAMG